MDHNKSLIYAYGMWLREIQYIESKNYLYSFLLENSFYRLMGARDMLNCVLCHLEDRQNNKLFKSLLYHYRIEAKEYSDYRKGVLKYLGIVGQKYKNLISDLKNEILNRFLEKRV